MSASRALETQSNQNKSTTATSSVRQSSRLKEPSSSSSKPSTKKDIPSNGLTLEEKTLAINVGSNITDFLKLKKEFERASSSQRREVLLSVNRLFQNKIKRKGCGSPDVKLKLLEIQFSTNSVALLTPFGPAILLNLGGFLSTTEEETIGLFLDLATFVLKKPQELGKSLFDHLTFTLGGSPSKEDLLAFIRTVAHGDEAEEGFLLKLSSRAVGQGRYLLALLFLHSRYRLLKNRGDIVAGWESCERLVKAAKGKAAVNA